MQTAVGDRYVLEAMKEHGYALGGEQSGHVIMLDHATTGDGTLTGLHAGGPGRRDRPSAARSWPAVMERLPQVLVNVPDVDKSRVETSAELAAAVAEAERELGATGRVLLRPSGTEPLVRVMVEAADIEQARSVAGRLADVGEVGAGLSLDAPSALSAGRAAVRAVRGRRSFRVACRRPRATSAGPCRR